MKNFLNDIWRPYQKIIFHDENEIIPPDVLMPLISASDFEKLCLYAGEHFSQQSLILSVPNDVFVVGDLHGNILDLLRILKHVGDISQNRILFLGDYVDRGQFPIEVVSLLFCISCLFPDNIFLIRGNHEFRKVNDSYGFKSQIIEAFNSTSPWEKANNAFDFLPLAAIIDNKIFCVHGGITPVVKNITELKTKYTRPIYHFEDDILYDLMWGDPTTSAQTYIPSLRGIGNQFGIYALNKFLSDNNFFMMIRGHQCVYNGVERLFKGKLVTVFSSSNYGEISNGRAGFVHIGCDCTIKEFIIYPYEIVIDRKNTHFIPIIIKPPLPIDLRSTQTISLSATSSRASSRVVVPPLQRKRTLVQVGNNLMFKGRRNSLTNIQQFPPIE